MQLELWARGLDRFMAARATHDQARFCDVRYSDFVADPIGTIESVYGAFGFELTGTAADAMRAVRDGGSAPAASGDGAVPRHRYALADFGLSARLVDERFTAYLGTIDQA